jgi:hypothetical protein
MDPTEWASLPEANQRKLVRDWYMEGLWGDYHLMAERAAHRLREELSSFVEVSNVVCGPGAEIQPLNAVGGIQELSLYVYTVLPESSRFKQQLPSRFAGFSVQQLDMQPHRDAYLNTWKRLFRELKGWNDDQTSRWAEQWIDALECRRLSAIYGYSPLKVALPELVADIIEDSAAVDLSPLYREIHSAIEEGVTKAGSNTYAHPDTMANYDWAETRRRFAGLIEEYRRKTRRKTI